MNKIREAVCCGRIASVRLMLEQEWEKVKVIKCPGDLKKRHLFGKNEYYDDYQIMDLHASIYTPKELAKVYGPIAFNINDKNKVILYPQVIIHYQDAPWAGTVEMKYFETNEKAIEFFNKLKDENNLEEIYNE